MAACSRRREPDVSTGGGRRTRDRPMCRRPCPELEELEGGDEGDPWLRLRERSRGRSSLSSSEDGDDDDEEDEEGEELDFLCRHVFFDSLSFLAGPR